MHNTEMLTTAQAALRLGLHVSTVNRMAAAGELTPLMKIPGKTGAYLFSSTEVDRLRAERAATVNA